MADSENSLGTTPSLTVPVDPCNTYGLATQGFVWAAISSVSGGFGTVKTVNKIKPDENQNVNVTSISSLDYAGDLNQVNSDLTVTIAGEDGHRLLTDIDDESIRTKIQEVSGEFQSKFDYVSSLVPEEATPDNKLADKKFVVDEIRKESANFRGNWATWSAVPETSADYPEDTYGNKIPNNNDFIIVDDASELTFDAKVDTDIIGEVLAEPVLHFEAGHVITLSDYLEIKSHPEIETVKLYRSGTWRFRFVGVWVEGIEGKSKWTPEYKINETPFTKEQWAAINSGITNEILTDIESTSGRWNNASTEIETTSANNRSVYTAVYGTSSNWDSVYSSVLSISSRWNEASTEIESTSADNRSVYTSVNETSSDWDSVYTSVSETSSDWNNATAEIEATSANNRSVYASVNETSANWNSVYTSVNTTSAEWNSAFTEIEATSSNNRSVYTSVNETSGNWDSVYTSVLNTSSEWNEASTEIESTSANNRSVYTSVNETSSDWNDATTEIETTSANNRSVYTSVNETSGRWNDASTEIEATSANNRSVYTSVNDTSANWDSVYSSVNETSAEWNEASTEIEATSSNNRSVYTSVNETSGNWDSVYTSVYDTSATWDSVYTSVLNTSSEWNGATSEIESTSANNRSVYTSVNETSGNWNSVYTSVNETSSDWNNATSEIESTSANNRSVYTSVNETSGNWDSVYTSVYDTSATWDSAEANANAYTDMMASSALSTATASSDEYTNIKHAELSYLAARNLTDITAANLVAAENLRLIQHNDNRITREINSKISLSDDKMKKATEEYTDSSVEYSSNILTRYIDSQIASLIESEAEAHAILGVEISKKIPKTDIGIANGVASLDENGKVPLNEINDEVRNCLKNVGTWNASSGNPPSANPVKGNFWTVTTSGTYDGTLYRVNDWILCNGTTPSVWNKVSTSGNVITVQGRDGEVNVIDDTKTGTVTDYTWSVNKIETEFGGKIDKISSPTGGKLVVSTSEGIAESEFGTTAFAYTSSLTSDAQIQLNNKQNKLSEQSQHSEALYKIATNSLGQVTSATTVASGDIPSLGIDKIDGLSTELGNKVDKPTFNGEKVIISNSAKTGIEESSVTKTELGYISGVTSSIQTQLGGKVGTGDIVTNVTSTDDTKVLAASQGKVLQDEINNLKSRGKFLSLWNCATGLPTTDPSVNPYKYNSGDYYIIGTIATGTEKNYKPNGTQYVKGTASTVEETEVVAADDVYIFDGTYWKLQKNTQKTITFANITGEISGNTTLQNAFDAKVENATINGSDLTVTNKKIVIPLGNDSTFGVYKSSESNGIKSDSGTLKIVSASNAQIDSKTSTSLPITPSNLDYAVKKSLVSNLNTLTDSEKEIVRNWVGTTQVTFVDFD